MYTYCVLLGDTYVWKQAQMTMLADELPLKTIGKYDDVGLGLHKNEVFNFIIVLLFIEYYFDQFHYEFIMNWLLIISTIYAMW